MPKYLPKYYFGRLIEGKLGRFGNGFTEEEFVELLLDIGGRLPRGFVVWEFNQDETIFTSERVQEVGRLPIISNPIGGWADPAKAIRQAIAEEKEDMKWTEIKPSDVDLSGFEQVFPDCFVRKSDGIRLIISIRDGFYWMKKEVI